MTFEKRNRLADVLEETFGTTLELMHEMRDYAQDGTGHNMEELCEEWLAGAPEKFAAALKSLREEAR